MSFITHLGLYYSLPHEQKIRLIYIESISRRQIEIAQNDIFFPVVLLNAFPNNKFWTLPNLKSLHTTILSLMKMAESSQKV